MQALGTFPAAWRVKDFADGWILCHSKAEAEHLSREQSGAAIEPLYAEPIANDLYRALHLVLNHPLSHISGDVEPVVIAALAKAEAKS